MSRKAPRNKKRARLFIRDIAVQLVLKRQATSELIAMIDRWDPTLKLRIVRIG